MTGPGRTAVVALCSAARVAHLEAQLAAVGDSATRIVVWLDDTPAPPLDCEVVLHVPPTSGGLRLARGRNAGADEAVRLGCDLIVFLDADCIPGAECLTRYRGAAAEFPDAILCGPVTYLPEGFTATDQPALRAATAPHPARPAPPAGDTVVASNDEYALFWSLSFALTRDRWRAGPRFDESYVGYGGEDTDFGFSARATSVALVWVGGADAYHQYHPTSSPPWAHLDDILINGARFAEKWGRWPMEGWLEEFRMAGAVQFSDGAWRRT